MKIYESSVYVNKFKDTEWYQLQVINQWDWKTKPICDQLIDGHLVNFSLHKCIAESDRQWSYEEITDLTQEMKDELIKMRYTLKDRGNR